ncbi:methyl-accepting chemotaxis protein [Paracoccus aerodenitrificans]|uniref:methyl-accepting chemotaxis protein n=1 Tax=Paracoccus aerodenitrificans TaxID=3017781 RepID=UPI0022F05D59|nr:methyl-accepting chemotaxis protein [Paracoccus aerodenitrificans]WBU64580.1 methyl-accepting chemotaxis protein [Paracoccus aerodenitrificans]
MTESKPLNDNDRVRALSLAQAMIEFTPDGTIVEANENFLGLMGYRRDDIVGRHHRIFVRAEQANTLEYSEFWRQLGQGAAFTGEFERLNRTGAQVWISGSYVPLMDDQGKVRGVLKMATDITAQKMAVSSIIDGLVKLADCNVTHRLTQDMPPEFAAVRDSYNRTVDNFSSMVNDIRKRAAMIHKEAEQIAQGADDLARRGESQAASLEQTAAAVEQISGNTAMTSNSAQEVNTATKDAEKVVNHGNDVVADAVAAIERIEQHTKSMGEFTSVIENFAFQTNLLSINAAVEAARAGEVGRGFAVVAQEVRNLAQQSGKASQSIAELIGKSEAEVKSGADLVRQTGSALNDIQTAVRGVVDHISGIAHATAEQTTGVQEVSSALAHLDGVNQANLSMSESYAGAASSLSSQVNDLTKLLEKFETSETADFPELSRRQVA